MTHDELLDEYKNHETVESALILLGKGDHADRLRAVALAWRYCPPMLLNLATACPEGETERWEWLWAQREIDYQRLAQTSGVEYGVKKLVAILMGNRLIYPDGTLSQYATKALRQRLKDSLDL